jgi:hypothetical protein
VRGPAEKFPFLGTGESILDVYQIVTDKIIGMLEAGHSALAAVQPMTTAYYE